MTRFVDEYMPNEVPGYPCISNPKWSTDLQTVDSGVEQVNQRWVHPLHRYALPDAIREHDTFEAIHDHWLAMRGPFYSFPFRDPLDFASVGLSLPNTVPTVTRLDQTIGTGDGLTVEFQLTKTYTVGSQTYTRNIYHPIVSTVLIGMDGEDPEAASPNFDWDVSRTTGIVTFEIPPDNGSVITAGYLFDVEVRFGSDDAFEGIVKTYGVSGFADLELFEVRPCS
jgi:uncharacterized protein (TIGR02217 family)